MKQTAAFAHVAALGKITVGETALVLFSIQINVEGTLLYKWRRTVDPDRQSTQARQRRRGGCRFTSACCAPILDILKHLTLDVDLIHGGFMDNGGGQDL